MRVLVHASLDFKDLMIESKRKLEGFGCEVLLPDLNRYQHIRDELGERERFSEIKRRLQRENGRNVANCDILLIVNVSHRGIENYIGGNSFYEMSIAFFLGKPIFLTNSIPDGLPYSEEIEAFNPAVIGNIETLSVEDWMQHASDAGIC